MKMAAPSRQISRQGSASRINRTFSPYGCLKIDLCHNLDDSDVEKLATVFNLPRGTLDEIKRKPIPSLALLRELEKRRKVSKDDVDNLIKGFIAISCADAAEIAEEFKLIYLCGGIATGVQTDHSASHEANPGSSTIGLSHQRTIPPPDQSDPTVAITFGIDPFPEKLDVQQPRQPIVCCEQESELPLVVLTVWIDDTIAASNVQQRCSQQLEFLKQKIWQESSEYQDHLSELVILFIKLYDGDLVEISGDQLQLHLRISSLDYLHELQIDVWNGVLAGVLQEIFFDVMCVEEESTSLQLKILLDEQSVTALESYFKDTRISDFQDSPFFCDYCKVVFQGAEQHTYHIQTAGHKEKIVVKDGDRPWKYREPLSTITNGKFTYCPDYLSTGSLCKNDCQCPYAHSKGELEEWQERHAARLKVIKNVDRQQLCLEKSTRFNVKSKWKDLIEKYNKEKAKEDGCVEQVGKVSYLESEEDIIAQGSNNVLIYIGEYEDDYVAVKELPKQSLQKEKELYERMKDRDLNNVLKISCIEEYRRRFYVVTPLCDHDLTYLIENPDSSSLSQPQQIKLCLDILNGLKGLHDLDIIHRDLKPNNVLISQGEAFLGDFGISRNLSGQTTLVTNAMGTQCWLASECCDAEGDTADYKKASDVQVAAFLMYYILSKGHHPFEATFPYMKAVTKLQRNQENGKFNLDQLEDFPAECKTLLIQMLDKNPYGRPTIEDCLKQMEGVTEKCATRKSILAEVSNEHIKMSLPDVEIQCDDKLSVIITKKGHLKHNWTFRVKCKGKELQRVSFWHSRHELFYFPIKSLKGKQQHPKELLAGDLKRNAEGFVCVTVQFLVKGDTQYNLFDQGVIFDFGEWPCLCQQLLVRVDAKSQGGSHHKDDSWESFQLVPYDTTLATDKFSENLLKRYPLKTLEVKLMDNPSQENFQEYFRRMTWEEEKACKKEMKRFNGRHRMLAQKNIDHEVYGLVNLDRCLWGKITMTTAFDDSEASQLVRKCVRMVWLKFDVHPEKVYEAEIVVRRNLDLREFDNFYVSLSEECVQDQKLQDKCEIGVQVQFKIDRMPFCKQLYAIDNFKEKQLLFPPGKMFPRFLTVKQDAQQSMRDDGGNVPLNHRQEEAKNFISKAKNIVPFRQGPSLLIGPFGTGKTLTLAQTITEIMKSDNKSKLLVCTHSNSAADLFITEYLKNFFDEYRHIAGRPVLRLYAADREPLTVPDEIRDDFCIQDANGRFAKPTIDHIKSVRIVITTLSTAIHLVALGGTYGIFSHIFVDEAGQALETETMMPLALAGPRTVVVLSGDHKQLRPHVFSEMARRHQFRPSMLERLFYWSMENNCNNAHFLTDNYRMEQEILDFIGVHCYQVQHFKAVTAHSPQRALPTVTFSTVQGTEEKRGLSYINAKEAEEIVEQIDSLRACWPDELGDFRTDNQIAVLASYISQVKHLRIRLRKKRLSHVVVDTVHNVQGKQFQVVFISSVRTRKVKSLDSKEIPNSDYLGMMSDEGELITAFTRARSCLFVVGDPLALCNVGGCKNIWKSYIGLCRQKNSLKYPESIEAEINSICATDDVQDSVMNDSLVTSPGLQPPLPGFCSDESVDADGSDIEMEYKSVDQDLCDEILKELDKQVNEERKRQDSESKVDEDECVTEEQSSKENAAAEKRAKPGRKRKGRHRFRMLEGEERVVLERIVVGDQKRSQLEGAFQEEEEEEEEDMSDEEQKEFYLKKAREDPEKYPFCLVRFAKFNKVYGIPCDNHSVEKIFLSNKRRRKRALDGDQAVVKVISKKDDHNDVTYGEVMWVKRHTDLKWKKIVCTLDPDNIGLMCPIECRGLQMYPKMFIFPSGVIKQTHEGIKFSLYSINPKCQEQKIQCKENLFVRYVEMRDKLFVVQYSQWFPEHPYPMGIVTDMLRECNSLPVGIKILNLQHGVKEKWPNSLLQHNVMQFSSEWQVPTKELEQRQAYDLRKKPVFTIGNPGYGDFALHIEKFENNAGFQLGIHITDVAYFIGKDTLLDKEVLKRASSFYNDVSNQTYVASHMLPEVFSTNLCVFKPGKDRLAVSIILTLDESNASVRETVIGRSVVSCKQNLTFEEVENFLSNHYNGKAEFEDNITEQLEMLYKISTFVSPVDPIQMLKDKNFINYPSAVTLIQKVVSLLNDAIVSKLDVLSGPKLVYHQPPILEEDLKDWSETFKDDACSLLNPPSMLTQELENSGNGAKDEYMPLLRGTHEDVNNVLKYGKDKIFELEKILVCVDRFPQQNAALAQLRAVIPPKELIVTEAVPSLNLYRYPCLAPLRSYPDLISQRMLIAILEGSENPYLHDEDISHIAHHCFRQMENAQKYEENVEMLVLALKLKVVPHSLQAVVHSASDEKLELTYPFQKFLDEGRSSTAVAQCHLKPGKRPEKVESKAKSIQLNWRNRIYDYETKQVNLRSHNNKLWLSTHEHIHHIPIDDWQRMVDIVRQKKYLDLAKLEEKWPTANQRQLQRKDIHEDKGEVITEVTCERVETKKGSAELKKYVEFNRQFNPGDVVQVQLTSKMQHGIPAPAIQLIKLTPKHGICLEHRAMPVECFTEIAERLPHACTTIQEYMDAWTPLLKMLIAYTTIMNDETIVIHGISINWFKKDGSVCGHFTLEKKWCDDRQIILSVLQRKKKGRKSDPPDPSMKSVLSDYICVRLNGYKLTDTVRSNLQKLGSKDLSDAWKTEIPLPSSASLIVHGIAGTTNIGRPSDTENYDVEFQVTQKSCELPDELFDNQEAVTCTVELIPKSEPEKRMEAALATIGNGGELVKTIVLQEPDFHIDDELQKILDHGKRKLDNKDVFVRRFNVDNECLNDSQKEAVRLALIQPFTVIQGPPGTGKTRTGACLTVLLADINREVKNKKQVLYCGPSNKSVDVIAMYLQKYKTKKMKFVRVYSDFIEELDFPIPGVESAERKFTRDIEEVQKTDIQKDSLHYLIRSQNCSFSVKINQMYKKLKDGTLHPTLKNIRDYKALVKDAKIEVLKKMEVILCTCSASGHFILKEKLDILQCVIDEAGMCFELDTLVPLVCHTPKQVVLIGDHKQLRPIVQEPRVKQLGADISLMEKYQGTAHTLSIQYRMHEEICKFPSKEFYDNQLVTDESVNQRTPRLPSYIWPGKGRVPQVFCHIEGLEDTQTVKTSEGNENSRSNRIEAKEIVRVAKYLVDQRKVKPEDVAILSQYKLQCNIIHKMLQETHPEIKVQTIIKSQGSEWDYVLLSTVRSLPEDEIPETPGKSWRRTNLGFIEDENQMNVGITRAMQGLIIIGNRNLLKTCKIWRKLLEHFENIHAVIPADQFPTKGAQKTKKTSS